MMKKMKKLIAASVSGLLTNPDIPWYGPLYLMQYFDVTKV